MAESTDITMPEYLYNTYNGKGPVPRIYIPALVLWSIALAGYVGNTLVIMATFKNKKLQGSCNFFIAYGCFADICHTSAHWVFVYTTITGNTFIPYDECLWYQTIPQIFVTVSVIMTLLVGIERLFAVLFPLTYQGINKKIIIIGGVIIAFVVSFYFYLISLETAFSENGKLPVLCVIVNSLGGRGLLQWFNMCVLVNLIDLLVYTLVWVMLKFKANAKDEGQKVFKALFAIMFTVAFGWLANAFCQAVIVPAYIKVEDQYEFMIYFGIPVNVASSSGFVTLYIFSKEYRRTFQDILNIQKVDRTTTTTSISPPSKGESAQTA